MSGPKTGFAFIVDTDSYAGNFEREMTAHITGVIGECEVGEEYVDEDYPFEGADNVMQVADDNGCSRPTECWVEPRTGSYNAVAIFFYKKPTPEQISYMKSRAESFEEIWREEEWNKDKHIHILGYRLIEFKSSQSEEAI